ncbi:hypothetical protein LH935_28385 (plasmid) [Gordonia polyisoprenivorans]|uniref:hypothetical protein n=1 Tax=Gordonia polyisoprenivorans TaxID=84595 RepID=UPI002234A178|nr:hypothetical protein LH935_28385 [Gordonia polyisoprenivorans]
MPLTTTTGRWYTISYYDTGAGIWRRCRCIYATGIWTATTQFEPLNVPTSHLHVWHTDLAGAADQLFLPTGRDGHAYLINPTDW